MKEEELLQLIEKYKNLSIEYEPDDEEASMAYERFAEFLENNPKYALHFDYEEEKELWENFKEAEAEVDNYWDVAFPEGDDDDSITDYLAKT
jgi:hypothetical protein